MSVYLWKYGSVYLDPVCKEKGTYSGSDVKEVNSSSSVALVSLRCDGNVDAAPPYFLFGMINDISYIFCCLIKNDSLFFGSTAGLQS